MRFSRTASFSVRIFIRLSNSFMFFVIMHFKLTRPCSILLSFISKSTIFSAFEISNSSSFFSFTGFRIWRALSFSVSFSISLMAGIISSIDLCVSFNDLLKDSWIFFMVLSIVFLISKSSFIRSSLKTTSLSFSEFCSVVFRRSFESSSRPSTFADMSTISFVRIFISAKICSILADVFSI